MTVREEVIRRLNLAPSYDPPEDAAAAIALGRDALDNPDLLHLFTRMAWFIYDRKTFGVAHDINNELFLILNNLVKPDLKAAREATERCSALTASLLEAG